MQKELNPLLRERLIQLMIICGGKQQRLEITDAYLMSKQQGFTRNPARLFPLVDEMISLINVLEANVDDATGEMLAHTVESVEGLGRDGHVLSPLAEQDYETVKNACENNMRIISTFSPKQFKGDILLFVAADSHGEPPIESWKPYVDGHIWVHEIDGTHDSIMDARPVGKIGKALATELDKQRTTKQSLVQWRTK